MLFCYVEPCFLLLEVHRGLSLLSIKDRASKPARYRFSCSPAEAQDSMSSSLIFFCSRCLAYRIPQLPKGRRDKCKSHASATQKRNQFSSPNAFINIHVMPLNAQLGRHRENATQTQKLFVLQKLIRIHTLQPEKNPMQKPGKLEARAAPASLDPRLQR